MTTHACSTSIIKLRYGLYNTALKKYIWIQELEAMGFFFSLQEEGGVFFSHLMMSVFSYDLLATSLMGPGNPYSSL